LRLDKNASIAGQPVKRIRDLLRRMGSAHWSDQAIADFFHLTEAQANALTNELVGRGLLEESERRPDDNRRWYELGSQGPRFASARLLQLITRAKAERIVAAFLQRVEEINERQELLERVCEARVFGSYLEGREYLGDVDIAVRTERKESSGKDWVRESLRRADESGHKFSSYIDRLSYGHTEVMRLLQAGTQYLSLHTIDDLEKVGTQSRILFKDSSDSQ